MVYVADFEFYMDKYEVTNALYASFLSATGRTAPDPAVGKADWNIWSDQSPPAGYGDHPVVGVSREDAAAFCAWAGKRLPTEAEWQQACQGKDQRLYPWGNGVSALEMNYEDSNKGETTRVGSFPEGASPYGALDMAGNVWEWTASPYKSEGGPYVLRGGSWFDPAAFAKCTYRFYAPSGDRNTIVGFRCVQLK